MKPRKDNAKTEKNTNTPLHNPSFGQGYGAFTHFTPKKKTPSGQPETKDSGPDGGEKITSNTEPGGLSGFGQ